MRNAALEIQKAYKEYIRWDIISSQMQDEMVEHPDDQEMEEIADEAYKTYWAKREALVNVLMLFLKCDRQGANAIIGSDKLESIMNSEIV